MVESMNPTEFKSFTLFLLDLEEILERAYQAYTICIGSDRIHIRLGKPKESRLKAGGK